MARDPPPHVNRARRHSVTGLSLSADRREPESPLRRGQDVHNVVRRPHIPGCDPNVSRELVQPKARLAKDMGPVQEHAAHRAMHGSVRMSTVSQADMGPALAAHTLGQAPVTLSQADMGPALAAHTLGPDPVTLNQADMGPALIAHTFGQDPATLSRADMGPALTAQRSGQIPLRLIG